MNDVESQAAGPDAASRSPNETRPGLARWKKWLMIGAAVLLAAGVALWPIESGKREELRTQSTGSGSRIDGSGQLLPDAAPGTGGTAAADGTLSPGLMKMGFSFFAAFAVGLAFRSFLKLALIFIGLQMLALFGLSYLEWVTVNWQTMSGAFDHFTAKVEQEAQSFQTFITGSLPQAGLATLGLIAGFKK